MQIYKFNPIYRVVRKNYVCHLGAVINIKDKAYLTAFGNNLRKLRSDAAMSQEALGLEAGLGKNQIGLIERAEINVTLSTIKCLADALKIHPKDLLDF